MTQFLQGVIDALSLGSLYAVFALSVAVIFGVARVVNFANGELITIAGYAMVFSAGLFWPLVVVIAILTGVLIAVAMDRGVFRFVRDVPPTTLLIVSFGVSYFLQKGLLLLVGSRPKTLDFGGSLIGSISVGSLRVGKLDILTIGVTAVLVAVLGLMLNRSTIGRQIRAAAEDFTMARLLGIRANRVIAAAFAISGLLAAVAGVLLTIKTATLTPTFGVQPVIIAFVAVVVGGIGSLTGAAAGGLVMGVVTVALQTALPDDLKPFRDVFLFTIVIVVLLVRPQGILPPSHATTRV